MLHPRSMSRILLRPHSHAEFVMLARAFAAERRAGGREPSRGSVRRTGFERAADEDGLDAAVRSYAESLRRRR